MGRDFGDKAHLFDHSIFTGMPVKDERLPLGRI